MALLCIKCRFEDNIRLDLREVRWRIVDWIHMGQNRANWWVLVNRIMNLQVT
jgi:hypothetical protein